MRYETYLAWMHLLRRRRSGFISLISWISILGVAVGVMALIVVLAVMSGFDRELKKKIVGVNSHILVEKAGGIEDGIGAVRRVQEMRNPEIKSVARVIQGQAIIRSEQTAIGVVVRGVDQKFPELEELEDYVSEGDYSFAKNWDVEKGEFLPSILIGRDLAGYLGVRPGDDVVMISPRFEKKKLKAMLKLAETRTFRVRGIFSLGMNDFDNQLVLMDLKQAQSLYQLEDRVSGLSIRLHDVDKANMLKHLIREKLGADYYPQSWMDMNHNFFSALKVEKSVMTILLFLIILVAAFNIVSTLVMVVMEKTKDIGVLKTIGATRWGIQQIFILEGFIIGLLGVACGGVSGVLIAENINSVADFVEKVTGYEVFPKDIYYFSSIPAQINYPDILFIVVTALLMTVAAAVYPSLKGSRLKPTEALRYE